MPLTQKEKQLAARIVAELQAAGFDPDGMVKVIRLARRKLLMMQLEDRKN